MASSLPNFFIIGAAKAGTTALHDFLTHHPMVCMSSIKEPNFYSHEEIDAQELYYPNKNVKTKSEYQELFAHALNGQILGESSVSYIFYEKTAKKIFDEVQNAKIIVILRNPIDRALSHYGMDQNIGMVKADLDTVFYEEAKFPNHFQQYFKLGKYFDQLRRYYDVFPKEQIKVMFYEDLVDNEDGLIKELCSFLEINKDQVASKIERSNITARPKHNILRTFYESSKFRKMANVFVSDALKAKIQDKIFERSPKFNMSDTFKRELLQFYHADIKSLESLLNRDLKAWLR